MLKGVVCRKVKRKNNGENVKLNDIKLNKIMFINNNTFTEFDTVDLIIYFLWHSQNLGMHRWLAINWSRPVFAYNAWPGKLTLFACTQHCNHSQTCNLCGRQSAQAQQTQKNRYQEANSRRCNITGAQIRAALLRSLKLRERICLRPAQAESVNGCSAQLLTCWMRN